LVIYFCDQFVAPKIRHMQQMSVQCLSTTSTVFIDEARF